MNKILHGDALEVLKTLEEKSVQMCVTSPPYWGLRDYGVEGQLGLEKTPEEYVERMVQIFGQVKRVLKNDGTLWLNLGDSYSGSGKGPAGNLGKQNNERHLEHKTGGIVPEGLKPKDLVGIPWRVAFALQSDGWYLRQDIIWHKPNPMPESVTDRCTKAHEYIFLLSKSKKYYFDNEAIKELFASSKKEINRQKTVGTKETAYATSKDYSGGVGYGKNGRNKRSVWTVTTKPYKGAHFATFPPDLIRPCILAGAPESGIVLDPFIGSGTTAVVARELGRRYLGIELNEEYIKLANDRLKQQMLL